MSVLVQPNTELQRAQTLQQLFQKANCVGGALIVDILPSVPLVIFDAVDVGTARLAILIDGGKMLGSTGLAFQISPKGQIQSAEQFPRTSLISGQSLPFTEGKALDEFLRSAEHLVESDRAAWRAIDTRAMADLHGRLDRLMKGHGGGRKFFNTPLGSLEVSHDQSFHSLDGSNAYQVKLYATDLDRGRTLIQGEGTVRREGGYRPCDGGRMTQQQLERIVTVAEIRSRFPESGASAKAVG